MNYTIAIPSYGRPNNVKTLKLFPMATVFVPKSQYRDYKDNYPDADIVVADIEDENIGKKRNFLLDYYPEGTHLLMLNDDISGFVRKNGDSERRISPEEFILFAEEVFKNCEMSGVHLWGVYPVANGMFMSEKINRRGFIIGTVQGVIVTKLRYPEWGAKEDYDFTMQHIQKDGLVFRHEDIAVKASYKEKSGGCANTLKHEYYQELTEKLLQKYPNDIKINRARKSALPEVSITPIQYYGSPRWTGEITDCSMPMTFDTYNLCNYRCLYCFSYFQRSHSSRDYVDHRTKYVNVDKIKRIFRLEEKSQFEQYIKDRKVMQWGGLSEPFDLIDKKLGVTLELIRFFREINYPLSFSTKSNWMVHDERYREVIRGMKNWHFKISIITNNEAKAHKIEPAVPTPDERIDTIKQLKELGIEHITLRLRPYIIGATDDGLEELIRKASEAGADSVSTEFFCMEARADAKTKQRYKLISQQIGFDLWDFYMRHSYQQGYKRLNYEIKTPYIENLQKLCDKYKLRLYVSDAHHKAKSCNGSCCGLPPSMNYSRGQFTEAIIKCKENGQVTWEEIAKDMEFLKHIPWANACGFNTNSAEMRAARMHQSMYDFLHEAWNSPNNGNSPYKYFDKVMYPIKLDDKGDIVYKWNPERKQLQSEFRNK